MTRRPLLFLLLAALLGSACATSRGADSAALAPAPKERAFLWEVKPPKGGGTAYVVGSVHIGKQGQFAFPPSMEAAFAKADTLVVEADVTQTNAAQMQQLVLKLGVLPPGQSLSERLDPETQKLLSAAVERSGLPALVIERMRPWLAAIMLLAQDFQRAGYQADNGVDHMLLERAHGPSAKQIIELESAEGQLSLMANLSEPLQDMMLRDQLHQTEEAQKQFESITSAWIAGDGEAMANLLLSVSQKPEYRALYEKMFVERNVQMARRVGELLAEPRTHFIVVGAGHVVGADGILSLLTKQGYSVRQLGREP